MRQDAYREFMREAVASPRYGGRYFVAEEAHQRFGISFRQAVDDFDRLAPPPGRLRELRIVRDEIARAPWHLASALMPPLYWRARRPAAVTPRRCAGPAIAVVILSYERRRLIEMTLHCLWATVGEANLEVIVVDNGSHAEVVEYLHGAVRRGLVDKLILSPRNLGVAAGYNLGFASAREETALHMKLDNDIQILTPGWLPAALRLFEESEEVAVVGLNQVNHPHLRRARPTLLGGLDVIDWRVWTVGSAMLIHPRARAAVGWFNQEVGMDYFPDDAEYYRRLRRARLRGYYLAQYRAFHALRMRQLWPLSRLWPDPRVKQWRPKLAELDRSLDTRERPLRCSYPEVERTAAAFRQPGIYRL